MKLCIHDYCSSPICVFIVHLQQHSDIYHLLNHNNANFFKLDRTSQDFSLKINHLLRVICA